MTDAVALADQMSEAARALVAGPFVCFILALIITSLALVAYIERITR